MNVGTSVKVKPEYDIPEMFLFGGPSQGVIDHIHGQLAIVIVDGKAVPYLLDELEEVE
jgi:hypothetical protein